MEILTAVLAGIVGLWIGFTLTTVWEIKKIVLDIRRELVGR